MEMKAQELDFIEIENMLSQIIDVNPIDVSDRYRSLEKYRCPFCRNDGYGHEIGKDKIEMSDIKHDNDCAWIIANKQLALITPLADEMLSRQNED